MRARWLLATPLMLIGFAGPLFGNVCLAADLSWRYRLRYASVFGPDLGSFWDVVARQLPVYVGFATIAALVGTGFLVSRRSVTGWPGICVAAVTVPVIPGYVFAPHFVGSGPVLANAAGTILLAGVAWAAARVPVLIMTRPVTMDLARSALEVPFGLRATTVSLRIRHDGLHLERLVPRRATGQRRTTIPWHAFQAVRTETLSATQTWRLANGVDLTVTAGPALRIVGAEQEWLLPVTERTARAATASIRARRTAPAPPGDRSSPELAARARTDVLSAVRSASAKTDNQLEYWLSRYAPGARSRSPNPPAKPFWLGAGPHRVLVIGLLLFGMALAALGISLSVIPAVGQFLGYGPDVPWGVVFAGLPGMLLFGPLAASALVKYRRFLAGKRYFESHPTDE